MDEGLLTPAQETALVREAERERMKLPKAPSAGEERFWTHWRAVHGDPLPERERRFHPVKGWRFDFCWPGIGLAVEIQGLTKRGGAHQRIEQIERDYEKINAAQLLGWVVLQFSQAQVKSGEAIDVTVSAYEILKNSPITHPPPDGTDRAIRYAPPTRDNHTR